MSSEGFASTGLIDRISECSDEIALDLDELVGRKIGLDDGYKLITAIYFLKQDVEEAVSKLNDILTDDAVCN